MDSTNNGHMLPWTALGLGQDTMLAGLPPCLTTSCHEAPAICLIILYTKYIVSYGRGTVLAGWFLDLDIPFFLLY